MKPWIQQQKKLLAQLKQQLITLYLAYKHPETPWFAKVMAIAIIAYAMSPIDLIPDFIPVLGYLDDLVLLPLGIILAIRLIPKPIWKSCEEEAVTFQLNKKLGYIPAIIIGLIWLVLILWLVQRFI